MPVEERNRLRRAACEGSIDLIKRLMLKTNLQNPDPENGWTTLMYATRSGHAHTVEFLLNAGHEQHEVSKDFENNTVLMIAAKYNYLEVTLKTYIYSEKYLELIETPFGQTALIFAAQKEYMDIMKWLLECGVDINQTDYEGNTAAAAWDRTEAVTLLIERGIHFAVKNAAGWTALDYAFSTDIASHIQERGRTQFEESRNHRRRNNLKVNIDSIIGLDVPLTTRSATYPGSQRSSIEYESRSVTYPSPRPSGEYESHYTNSSYSSTGLSPNDLSNPIRRKESSPW
ncbi:hypothetical protein G9A89_008327 [Geosiphon pyriformis]|nr:hypothetical protein G9A89_008327 [Geosiphon pyriformis]